MSVAIRAIVLGGKIGVTGFCYGGSTFNRLSTLLGDELAAAAVWCALEAPAAMTGAILDVNGASYLRT